MHLTLICPHCGGEIVDAFESNGVVAVAGGVLFDQGECLGCGRECRIWMQVFEIGEED